MDEGNENGGEDEDVGNTTVGAGDDDGEEDEEGEGDEDEEESEDDEEDESGDDDDEEVSRSLSAHGTKPRSDAGVGYRTRGTNVRFRRKRTGLRRGQDGTWRTYRSGRHGHWRGRRRCQHAPAEEAEVT